MSKFVVQVHIPLPFFKDNIMDFNAVLHLAIIIMILSFFCSSWFGVLIGGLLATLAVVEKNQKIKNRMLKGLVYVSRCLRMKG